MKEIKNHINDTNYSEEDIWNLLKDVCDPEIPVVSVVDLGIVRNVMIPATGNPDEKVVITITPTYSGCPAMDVITINIKMKLLENGIKNYEIKTALSPAWTTDWMSEEGKKKLRHFGIAPPNPMQTVCETEMFQEQEAVQCPHCNSHNTKTISRFGSTACKALYQCNDCSEPFDYFKCH